MKKMLLCIALASALSGSAFAQAPAAPLQAPTVPSAAPTVAPINQLQQSIEAQPSGPTTVVQNPNQPSQTDLMGGSDVERAVSMGEAKDESTLFREVSIQQARLALITLMSNIEKKRMDAERERMKFAEEQVESQQKIGGAAPRIPGVAAPAGTAPTTGAPGAPSPAPAAAQAAPAAEEEETVSVRSVYSFDNNAYAELMIGSAKVVARPGMELINGDKVIKIDQGSVVVMRDGKRKILPLEGSASTAPQAIAPFAQSQPQQAPRNLPPMPNQ